VCACVCPAPEPAPDPRILPHPAPAARDAGAASDDDSDIVTRRATVLYDFEPQEEDEVGVTKGQAVEVVYEVGGWLQVRRGLGLRVALGSGRACRCLQDPPLATASAAPSPPAPNPLPRHPLVPPPQVITPSGARGLVPKTYVAIHDDDDDDRGDDARSASRCGARAGRGRGAQTRAGTRARLG
jgi:hypothetical protein